MLRGLVADWVVVAMAWGVTIIVAGFMIWLTRFLWLTPAERDEISRRDSGSADTVDMTKEGWIKRE